MIEIGLTGGIGSGKSTVAEMFVDRGAVLIDADQIVRDLQQPGGAVFDAMVDRWGSRIVAEDGTLARDVVASIVFSDEAELTALNSIVHPAVAEEMKARRAALHGTDAVVVLDIPLLVRPDGESLADRYADLAAIIVVDVDPDITLDRLVTHRGFDPADAQARIAAQASRDARRAVADRVLDNSGSLEDLKTQVADAWDWVSSLPHPPAVTAAE